MEIICNLLDTFSPATATSSKCAILESHGKQLTYAALVKQSLPLQFDMAVHHAYKHYRFWETIPKVDTIVLRKGNYWVEFTYQTD